MNSLSHHGEAVNYVTTQQTAVRVSQRGKQNITQYVKDSARFTIISQSEKIGKRDDCTNILRKTLTYPPFSIPLNDWEWEFMKM